jgi:divalent metal cation (Fe/Co/Zn/Cd) transporter
MTRAAVTTAMPVRSSPDLVEEVEEVVRAAPGIEAVDAVRIRWIGHELRAEVEFVSDRDLTLAQAHTVSEAARHRLLHEIPRLGDALIHSPCRHDGSDPHADVGHHWRSDRR